MKQELTAQIIYRTVAEAFELLPEELTGRDSKRSPRRIAEARQVAGYLLKIHTDYNLKDISTALQFGDRQYANYCIKKTIGSLGQDLNFRILVSRIELRMLEEMVKMEGG